MDLTSLKLPFLNKGVKLTVKQYLTNPSGKNSAHTGQRYILKEQLEKKFFNLIKKYKKFNVFCYSNKGKVVVHGKIPSESVDNFFYDVVVELRIEDSEKLDDLCIRLFSNDQHFIYTYAYVANKADLLVNDLKNHLPKECLTKKPKNTNFNEVFGFHKASFYLLKYIKMLGFKNINELLQKSKTYNKTDFLNSVSTFESKTVAYENYKKKQKKKVSNNRKVGKK